MFGFSGAHRGAAEAAAQAEGFGIMVGCMLATSLAMAPAVILAQGFAPLDELPATDDDWAAAATLLTTLWRLAGVSDVRVAAIEAGHPDGLAIVKQALADGLARDSEHGDGSA